MGFLRPLVRWLLVPVSAAMVVAGVIAAARWAVSVAGQRCAAESMVGGACVESWHTSMVEAAIYVGVVLVALGLVMVPSMIAPGFKRAVAALGFLLTVGGIGTIYFLTAWAELLGPLAVAAVMAAAALWWAWSGRRLANEG